jgi:hypothetical protein
MLRTWAEIVEWVRARHRVVREDGSWIGFRQGRPPVPVVIGRDGAMIELFAGIARATQVSAEELLAAARPLPVCGLVLEKGAYLLRVVRPLEGLTEEGLEQDLARLCRSAERLRARFQHAGRHAEVFLAYAS